VKVLIGCEYSGTVRDAFAALGHDAWSCDLLPDVAGSNHHIRDDIRTVMHWGWDLMFVAHPPCTRLCNSGVRWLTGEKNPKKVPSHSEAEQAEYLSLAGDDVAQRRWLWRKLDEGADLFSACLEAPIAHIAVENPLMHKYAKARVRNYREADQTFQPWEYGTDELGPDNEKKRTALWLRNLPALIPTGSLDGSTARDSVHKASPGADRGHIRSLFFPGVAAAMARQWTDHIEKEISHG
jgi:hypothetical protein